MLPPAPRDDRDPVGDGPGAARVRPVPHSGGSPPRRVIVALVLMPLAGLVYFAARGSGDVWPHLIANVLPHALRTTVLLLLGVGVAGRADRRRHGLARHACSAFPAGASSNGRCSCRSPCRPTSSPTPISTCCIRSGRCRRRCASCSASTRPRDLWFPEIRSLGGCIFLLGVVLYPYVYLPVRARLPDAVGGDAGGGAHARREPPARLLARRRCRWRGRPSPSASASR